MNESTRSWGIGVDVIDRHELARLVQCEWFLRYCYSCAERRRADRLGPGRRLEFLAGRFAAKEAILKLLGRGLLQGFPPREICVGQTADGAPTVRFHGPVADLRPPAVVVSIAHKKNVVVAVAISGRRPLSPEEGAPATGAGPRQGGQCHAS